MAGYASPGVAPNRRMMKRTKVSSQISTGTARATARPLETLTVEASTGPGSGTVTSAPAGIECGSDWIGSFDHGTTVVES